MIQQSRTTKNWVESKKDANQLTWHIHGWTQQGIKAFINEDDYNWNLQSIEIKSLVYKIFYLSL